MLILFGARASRIGTEEVSKPTVCPNCKSQQSFIISTFGKYFHLFFIPVFPLWRKHIIECHSCKKTFEENDLSEENKALLNQHIEESPVGRPIWHCCGCLLLMIVGFVFGCMVLFSALTGESEPENKDPREVVLDSDLERLDSGALVANDSIARFLKTCVGFSIEGIDTDEIKYLTKRNGIYKLLVLIKVEDFRGIEKSSRKVLVQTVEECLNMYLIDERDYLEYYIGVDGNWNMLMVQTPDESDLGGGFANPNYLLPFYDESEEYTIDTLDIIGE